MKRLLLIGLLWCGVQVSAQEQVHTGIEEIDKKIEFVHLTKIFGTGTDNKSAQINLFSEILSMMEERGLENDAYYQLLHERAACFIFSSRAV